MKLFVVTWSCYDGHQVFGVFSTRGNADAFCRDWARAKEAQLGHKVIKRSVARLIEDFLTVEEFELNVVAGGLELDGIRSDQLGASA